MRILHRKYDWFECERTNRDTRWPSLTDSLYGNPRRNDGVYRIWHTTYTDQYAFLQNSRDPLPLGKVVTPGNGFFTYASFPVKKDP